MAFIFEKDRGLMTYDPSVINKSHLGPGKYLGQQQIKVKERKGVPFLSTSNRSEQKFQGDGSDKGLLGLDQQIHCTLPGPGSYELAKPLVNNEFSTRELSDEVILLRSKNNVGQSNFISTINRFPNSANHEIPGPGSYQILEKKQKRPSIAPYISVDPETQLLSEIRVLNEKRRNTSLSYKSNHPQIDSFDKSQISNNESQDQRRVRSCHTAPTDKRASLWSLSTVNRFDQKKSQIKIGPGKYYKDSFYEPSYKKGFSATFKQRSRTTVFAEIFNQSKQFNLTVSSTPLNKKSNRTPKINNQCSFISGFDRFKDEDKGYNNGPGQYLAQEKPQEEDKSSFFLTNQLFSQAPKRKDTFLIPFKSIKQNPGVGEYEIISNKSIAYKVSKKAQTGQKGNFGINQPRFKQIQNYKTLIKPTPGPGQYHKTSDNQQNQFRQRASLPENAVKPPTGGNAVAKITQAISDIPQSIFKSSTQRQPYGKLDNENPSCVDYCQDQHSIKYKADKQVMFIDNLKKIDVNKPPFDVKKPRFEHYEIIQKDESSHPPIMSLEQELYFRSKNPEPMFITQNESFTKPSSSRAVSQPFVSKAKRHEYIIMDENVPGPGIYESGRVEWNTRSYNIKYQRR